MWVALQHLKVAGASFGQWEISVIWGLGVAMAIYLTAGFPARILIPLLPLHCGCLPVSTSAKLFLLSFHKLPALSCCGFSLRALLQFIFRLRADYHHIVRGSVESVDLAGTFSTYPNPHINFVQAFAVEMVITAILMGLILALTDDGNGVPRGPFGSLADWSTDCGHWRIYGPIDRFCHEPSA